MDEKMVKAIDELIAERDDLRARVATLEIQNDRLCAAFVNVAGREIDDCD